MKKKSEKILVSDKLSSVIVLLSDISEKLHNLEIEMAETRIELDLIQKRMFWLNPVLDKEDYD